MKLTQLTMKFAWASTHVTEIIAYFDDDYLLHVHYHEKGQRLWYLDLSYVLEEPNRCYYLVETRCLTPGPSTWSQPEFGRHLQAVMDAFTHPFESIPLTGDRRQLALLVEIVSPIKDHIEALLNSRVPLCREK